MRTPGPDWQLVRLECPAGSGDPSGKSLIGTLYALNTIYAQQHPKDCAAAKYLLWVPVRHGIGKTL